MTKQYGFYPGSKSSASKIINYVAEYNRNLSNYSCYCIPDKYDKNTPGSLDASIRISNSMRIAQILKISKNGRINYGNYLGESKNLNYLGRFEGMPGGSGGPPLNKF